MSETARHVLILLVVWAAYFALHSLLASLVAKRWVERRLPGLLPWYRLAFNTSAALLLLPPLWLTYAWHGPWLWRWEGTLAWLANGLALLAAFGFLWTLRYYSGAEFLGLSQLRRHQRQVEDQERLRLSPLHRYVRHPWYALGLVILWTRDMDPMFLATAVAATAYLWLGSRLEERKLLAFHGDRYRRYRERVPALVPLPWRHLSRQDAKALMENPLNHQHNH